MSWLIESNVNFCAASFKAVLEDDPDAAVYSVLGKYLQDEYLHSKIREKRGAYGSAQSIPFWGIIPSFFPTGIPDFLEQ